jgi:hypothetical protein
MCLETHSGLKMGTLTIGGQESIAKTKRKGGARSISHQKWLTRSLKQYETPLKENDM